MSKRRTALLVTAGLGLALAVANKAEIVDAIQGDNLIEGRSRDDVSESVVVPVPKLNENEKPLVNEEIQDILTIARDSMQPAITILNTYAEATSCDPDRYILNQGTPGDFRRDFIATNNTNNARHFVHRDMSEETITNVDMEANVGESCGAGSVPVILRVLHKDMTDDRVLNTYNQELCMPKDDAFGDVFEDIDDGFEQLCN